MASVFLRTVIIYFILLASIRLMGKRQVGELEVSELIITIMLSELAIIPVSNKNAPLLHALVPVLFLLSAEVIISYITSKSSVLRALMIGKPSVLIDRGVLDQKELSRLRMSVAELLGELRLKGVGSISEVEYAIVEDNGQLSVFKKEEYSPLTPNVAGIAVKEGGIAHCVVVEGKIFKSGLASARRERKWVDSALAGYGIDITDVCIMTVDDGGAINIIMKGNRQ